MSRQRTTGTDPELAIRRGLHGRGLRFRVNVRGLPGRPDIVFSKARIVVQVDGCFWHGCPDHGVAPKSNAAWWKSKLAATKVRDARDDAQLADAGWLVIRVWEHEDAEKVVERVDAAWKARRISRGGQDADAVVHESRTGQP